MFFSLNSLASTPKGSIKKQEFGNKMILAGQYMQENNLVAADSILLSINDNEVELPDSLLSVYFYCKGIVKYGLKDYETAIPYYLKVKDISDTLKIFDYNYFTTIYNLSYCYYHKGEYSTAENILRWAIVKHKSYYEHNPMEASWCYALLANTYEALEDTLQSEKIHYELKQHSIIQQYLNEHPNDSIGQKILKGYNENKIIENDYYNLTRSIDQDYIEIQWGKGSDMSKIGADFEAIWCYENCIRNGNKYLGKYDKAQKWAYLDLLRLYATKGYYKDFDSFLPIAVDYINNVDDNDKGDKENAFAIGKVYGNIFLEQGNYTEAYKCYMISKRYLEAGNTIPDQEFFEIQLYLALSRTCLSLNLNDEAISYCEMIEKKIAIDDKSHKDDLFKAQLYRCEALVNLNNFNKANELLVSLKQKTLEDFGLYCNEYVKVCFYRALNYYNQGRDSDVINELFPIIDNSDDYNEIWGDYWLPIYSLVAYAYIGKSDYLLAKRILEKLAEIEINNNGKVSENTIQLINECKSKQ